LSRYIRNHYFFAFDPEGNQLPYADEFVGFFAESREVGVFRAMAGENDGSAGQFRLPELPLYNANMEKGDYSLYHWPSPGGLDSAFALNMTYNADPYVGQMIRTRDFRIALSVALDREEMNEVMYLGIGTAQNWAPHPSTPYYPGLEYAQLNVEYDPDRANDILDKLMPDTDDEGFRLRTDNGERFVLNSVKRPGSRSEALSQLAKPMFAEVGIDFQWTQRDDAGKVYADGEVPMQHNGYDISAYQANPWSIQWPQMVPSLAYTSAKDIGTYIATKGEKGMAPGPNPAYLPLAPADTWAADVSGNMMKQWDLWVGGRAYPAFHPERIRMGKEIFKITAEELYFIPIAAFTGNMRGIFLNRNNVLNQPKTHVREGIGFHIYAWYFEGGMDNLNHPDNRSKLYKSYSFLGG